MFEQIGTLPIKWLNDVNNDRFFPVTNAKAVFDDEGMSVDNILTDLKDNVFYEEILYTNLYSRKSNNQLVSGRKYRITDYVTTTTQDNTSSAQHAFDLIVTAISANELDCKAQAVPHSGDTYFSTAGEDLSKWQVWYDINNDTSKYLWADTTNGKGVIYRMIDEWGNDCPYDFKNIQFKRKLTNGVFDRTNGTDTWVYTFSHYENGNIVDYSLNGMENDVARNIQKEYITFTNGGDLVYCLTNNVFFDTCSNNILGRDCNDNTFGNGFWNNMFLDNCLRNIFGSNCANNTFGENCTDNWFGNNCQDNSFGNGCVINTLENNCINITLGNDCSKISFRDANGNYGNFIRNVTVESGNKTIRIFKSGTQNATNYLQNIYIAHGFNQTLNEWKVVDSISRNLSYRTTVAVDSNGNTRIYNEDDIIQPNWNETSSSSPSYIQNKPDLDAALYEPVTYSQLVAKITNSQLVKGKKYRITDYVTTTAQTNTSSANHAFDLVVTATDVNKLDNMASALPHDGDTYFSAAESDLSKWQIWYDVNNDTSMYAWADSTNGKGVIYRMIDEWGNDCPYDFKNTLFTDSSENSAYTNAYTFNLYANSINNDCSLYGQYCSGNVIKAYYNSEVQTLNFNVFLNTASETNCHNNIFESDCYNNRFGNKCYGNTFGSDCHDNTFGQSCWMNVFGNSCANNNLVQYNSYNTFGNVCINNTLATTSRYNTFGNAVQYNTFGSNAQNNTLENECKNNSFGTYNQNNTFGNGCQNNTFENYCQNITFGNACTYNTFNRYSYNITFGNNCNYIRFGNASTLYRYNQNIVFENDISYVYLYNTTSPSATNYLQNIYVASGCGGTEAAYTTISSITRNNSYRTTVGRDSNGNIRIYNEDEPQSQADWNETIGTSAAFIKNKPTLSTVATSGSYSDLTDKPDLDAALYEPVTYSQLVTKISNSQLVKGKKYRVTDYVTTTVQTNTSSANHAFDLVVTSIDVNKLDHMASALPHSGDTYFSTSGAELNKWQIWYDVNNDTSEYLWADTTNGKGVIYRMIDEWGNDCPYDFKNIQFKRKLDDGIYDETNGTDTWIYTFSAWNSDDSVIEDASLITNSVVISDSSNSCYNNVIGVYRELYNESIPPMVLNDIVFLNTYSLKDEDYFVCYSNTFGDNCSYNTFGNYCTTNTFGNYCTTNTFGNNCSYNTFGNNCSYNTFGGQCSYNTFGGQCSYNTFGNYCTTNTFGDNCSYNTFGDNCSYNTFGNICRHISFGDSSNQGGTYCRYNIFENGTKYIRLYNTGTANDNNSLQNVYVAQGVSGSVNNYVEISTIGRNLSYRTTVARLSNGTIRIYREDEDDMFPSLANNAGKVLAVNSGATGVEWESIEIPELYVAKTYGQLKAMYNNGTLVPGQMYRITDYQTTTSQNDTSSAQHAFDLVVTATSTNTFDCKAQAVLHFRDTYFSTAGSDLSKWEIWYDINNDTSKYAWAVTRGGTGVIYRMIDEWGNDCPYDFKNILFNKSGNYTFSKITKGTVEDLSLSYGQENCYGNVIKPYYDHGVQTLNFILSSCSDDDSCNMNFFDNDCCDITLTNTCSYNKFGKECRTITLSGNCNSNVFGDNCQSILFGNNTNFSTIGGNCNNIIFGPSSSPSAYYENIIIEPENTNIRLYSNTPNPSNANQLKNVYISQGFNNTALVNVVVTRNNTYRTTVGRDSVGNVVIYNEDDLPSTTIMRTWSSVNS